MTTTRKGMKERIEEYKKELFEGDKDIRMFKDQAARIKHEKELEATPEPPSTESIIKEIHLRRGIRS